MSRSEEFVVRGPALENIPLIGLGEYLFEACETHKVKPAFIDASSGQGISFEDLQNRAIRLAIALRKSGFQQGDVIGICAHNTILYPVVVLATTYIGAVLAPYNNGYSAGELEHVVRLTKPKIMFCTERTRQTVTSVANKFAKIQNVVLVEATDGPMTSIPGMTQGVTYFEVASFRPARIADPKDTECLIMCSSGTTGLPKGVLITHYNVVCAMINYKTPALLVGNAATHTIGFLPPFHVFGLLSVLFFIDRGIAAVILEQFEPKLFLEVIQRYKIRAIAAVPPILTFLVKHPLPSQYDLSSLEEIGVGAAPTSRETEEMAMKRYPHLKAVRQGYGMTETTLGVLKVPLDGPSRPGSVGIVVPGTDLKIVDMKSKRPLGPNKPGELCVRGSLVMKGYIDNPRATAEAIDPEGWLHTGDVAYYDDQRWFYIVDRLKELIKYKGFQVPPAEVEALLMTHPEVLDAAVIGVPDEAAGELPKAFVVKKSPVTAEEIKHFVASQMSNPKHLRGGVEFVESIPKNPSGKILRRVLREKTARPSSKL